MGAFFFFFTLEIKINNMLQLKLTPQEIQVSIAAISNIQITGKDAHMISSLLRKYEDALATFKPVKKG